MKNKEIRDIINFIKKTDLDDVSIETEHYKIRVKKNNPDNYKSSEKTTSEFIESKEEEPEKIEKTVIQKEKTNNHIVIKSPIIGTFYRSSNPESQPFVNEGDKIIEGQTVCVIEAMKLFNEIESEISGIIIEILVDDASPVEYDQDLFIVDPS